MDDRGSTVQKIELQFSLHEINTMNGVVYPMQRLIVSLYCVNNPIICFYCFIFLSYFFIGFIEFSVVV